jgi:hypothetical protein
MQQLFVLLIMYGISYMFRHYIAIIMSSDVVRTHIFTGDFNF